MSNRIQQFFVFDAATEDDAIEARETKVADNQSHEPLISLARPRNIAARHQAAFGALLVAPRDQVVVGPNVVAAEEGVVKR